MIAQLRGMLWYEMLMHWRRGWLRIVFVGFVLTPVLVTLLARESWAQLSLNVNDDMGMITGFAIMATMAAWPMVLLAVPILAADAIPSDRQLNTRDLIESLPLTRPTYLFGKLLGVWGGLVISMALGGILGAMAIWGLTAPFNVEIWLAMWFVGLLFLALVNTAISVLLAAGRANRRQAVALGFAASPLFLAGFSRSSLFVFYTSVFRGLTDTARLTMPVLSLQDVAVGIAAVALAFLIAWGTLNSQNYRA